MMTAFANRTGTAPGTSTMYLPYGTMADMRGGRGLGIISPTQQWMTGRTTTPPGLPGTTAIMLNAQGGAAGLMGGHLGMISDEINRSLSGGALGVAPNDFELGRIFGYQPVHSGWIAAGDGTFLPAGGLGGAQLGLFDEAQAALKRQATLQTITTVAISLIAAAAVINVVRGFRQPAAAQKYSGQMHYVPGTARRSAR